MLGAGKPRLICRSLIGFLVPGFRNGTAVPGRARGAHLRRAEAILEERYMNVPPAELRMQ